jgi:hypothetical protein
LRIVRIALLAGLLAAASLGFTAGGAAGYGHADHPLAQIEFSANCNNPDFPLCFPPPVSFGLGGVWLWIEIDDGDILNDGVGEADVAGASCGHVRGEGGGATPIRGEFDWWWSATPDGDAIFLDPGGNGYYNVSFGPGGVISFPVTQGHYSAHPVPGVAIELQVAP